MANASLIGRMLHALGEYEAGRLSCLEFERFFDLHMDGLERIRMWEIHESRNLSYRLVVADCSVGEEEFINVEQVSVVAAELRQFLHSLPDGDKVAPETPSAGET